ncbi:ABC transporter ATP-binding protein [Biostraticola tofi]|uniref:Putative spermidine/putrescine transport system ATP-binding protein n=1 Tax=Biostraticola tofi TaxID=466109 RepID=A0A4R3Z168_9GAMM|nr:ABC transporter ATP-binding protein [Biostraticola tofi]TCV98731.1 putative spermidine/putrescine transport system ATP-binding protein [Biostraticola tofi]
MQQLQGKDVTLTAIRKTYGPTVALPQIDLAVRRGEFCTLLGASGSGKTTILKIIAGFEMPDSGSVQIAGRNVTRQPIADRNIGMVFQNYALFPHMSVFENVAFPLRMRKLAKEDIDRRVGDALALVSLGDYRRRLPGELSGGQQQRAALARSLVFNPDILLMDEPLGALDKNLRQTIQIQIKQLHQELGLTVVFVTHDQEEAMNLSDRIIIMDQGQIVGEGAPQNLYRQPDSRFVAGFLGECNFVAGNGSATVGVRPEHLLVGAASQQAERRYQGELRMATFCGLHWKLLIDHQGQQLVAYAPVDLPPALRQPGSRIDFGYQDADAMTFSDTT